MSTKKGRHADTAGAVRQGSVGWMLKTLSSALDADMIEALRPHDLTLSQFAILMTLLEEDDITQAEIGKRISMPGYATTRNIDALERNRLLKRHQHQSSRRSYSIRLTLRGRALGPTLFAIVQRINARLLSSLNQKEEKQLTGTLGKLLITRDRLTQQDGDDKEIESR